MEESDYLKERTVAEFLEWIDAVNVGRQGSSRSAAYRAREGLWKKYADEAEPLGRFLRGNNKIPRNVVVTMGLKSNQPDAVLKWEERETRVEITTTDHPGAVHNRRQLNKYGFGPGETNGVQTGKDLAALEAQGSPRDFGHARSRTFLVRQELDRLAERIKKKLKKKYGRDTILIVDSCSSSLMDVEESEVRDFLNDYAVQEKFREVWICVYPGRVLSL